MAIPNDVKAAPPSSGLISYLQTQATIKKIADVVVTAFTSSAASQVARGVEKLAQDPNVRNYARFAKTVGYLLLMQQIYPHCSVLQTASKEPMIICSPRNP
jgi:hypothetical protein